MAFRVTKSINNDNELHADQQTVEVLISSSSDVSTLPERFAPGSVAYTADLDYVAIKDPAGIWTEVE